MGSATYSQVKRQGAEWVTFFASSTDLEPTTLTPRRAGSALGAASRSYQAFPTLSKFNSLIVVLYYQSSISSHELGGVLGAFITSTDGSARKRLAKCEKIERELTAVLIQNTVAAPHQQ